MVESLKRAAMSLKDKITKTELERKLIESTDNNNWGVSSTILQEIAEKTSHPEDCATIMRYVWKSLKSDPAEWRRIYKSLSLIEHLLKFGSSRCVQEIKDETFKIRLLQDFSHNEDGIERGQGSKVYFSQR
jgi:epsin